jgi:Na+/proline symporter
LSFLVSRTIGASFRLFLTAAVLQIGLFGQWGVPFWVNVFITIALIWLYTAKGGIKTILWTDAFQTTFLISAVIISVYLIARELNLSPGGLIDMVRGSDASQMFFFDDPKSGKYFYKQFFAGVFITIAMFGLDQDLMQKNLTCRSLKDAQKNMLTFSGVFLCINILFLTLGALLYLYANNKGIDIPARTDYLYPTLALNHFGLIAGISFLLGITASSYASADSALASLTTSFCIDFLNFEKRPETERKRLKTIVHLALSGVLLLVILAFNALNDESVVTAVFTAAGYTYGPLLGPVRLWDAHQVAGPRPVRAVGMRALAANLLHYQQKLEGVAEWLPVRLRNPDPQRPAHLCRPAHALDPEGKRAAACLEQDSQD